MNPEIKLALRLDDAMYANVLYVDDIQADKVFSQLMAELSSLGVELKPKHKGMLFSKTGLSMCG